MQLRSGKTTQTLSIDATRNARYYGKIHNGNITITMEPYTPQGTPRNAPGKKSKPTIAKHSMTLRPRKLAPKLEKKQEPAHFSDMISMRLADRDIKPICFHTWLIARLRGFITTFHEIEIVNYKERILERTRLFGELIAVLHEYIEYITSTHLFANFSHVLDSKLLSFKTELTMLLNGEKLPGNSESCNFSHQERALLGNVRSDIVKLSMILKPLLPKIPIA